VDRCKADRPSKSAQWANAKQMSHATTPAQIIHISYQPVQSRKADCSSSGGDIANASRTVGSMTTEPVLLDPEHGPDMMAERFGRSRKLSGGAGWKRKRGGGDIAHAGRTVGPMAAEDAGGGGGFFGGSGRASGRHDDVLFCSSVST